MVRELEQTSEERLGELGFIQPEEQRSKERPRIFNFLIEGYREDGTRPFLKVHSNMKKSNGHKLKHGNFH